MKIKKSKSFLFGFTAKIVEAREIDTMWPMC